MGLMDRDYWRDRYNRRMGSSDPTHWREDELADSTHWSRGRHSSVPNPYGSLYKLLVFAASAIILGFALRAWMQYQALKQLEEIAVKAQADLARQTQALQRQAAIEAQKRQAQALAEEERVRARQIQRAALAQQANDEAAWMARKEAAWERYYRPSAACKRDAATVDCANEFIRAKRAFDAQYKG